MRTFPIALGLALLAAAPVWAANPTPDPTPPGDASSTGAAPSTPPLPVPTQTGNPHLVVASVTLNGGWRATKLIGSPVYDDQNQKVGSVDDLILSGQDKVTVAVISVGGFLGIGSKLVAVPYDQLRFDPASKDAKVILPGATKDSLNGMPNFTY